MRTDIPGMRFLAGLGLAAITFGAGAAMADAGRVESSLNTHVEQPFVLS